MDPEAHRAHLFSFGSFRLSVNARDADIDTVCIVPNHIEVRRQRRRRAALPVLLLQLVLQLVVAVVLVVLVLVVLLQVYRLCCCWRRLPSPPPLPHTSSCCFPKHLTAATRCQPYRDFFGKEDPEKPGSGEVWLEKEKPECVLYYVLEKVTTATFRSGRGGHSSSAAAGLSWRREKRLVFTSVSPAVRTRVWTGWWRWSTRSPPS